MFDPSAMAVISETDSMIDDMDSPDVKQSPAESTPSLTDTPTTYADHSASSNSSSTSLNGGSSGINSKESRRPRRKSTLTQQQKNQKRQRATQQQLTTLDEEFLKNPTPGANVRERIALEINMTERSVQIWFQNK
jgi:hypothetical protein